MELGNIKQSLCEIKVMLNMPIKAYIAKGDGKVNGKDSCNPDVEIGNKGDGKENTSPRTSTHPDGDNIAEGDLPGQMCRVLGKSKYMFLYMHCMQCSSSVSQKLVSSYYENILGSFFHGFQR